MINTVSLYRGLTTNQTGVPAQVNGGNMKSVQYDDIYDWYIQAKDKIYERSREEKWSENELAEKLEDLNKDYYERMARLAEA